MFYSKLFYADQIWQIPSLNSTYKQKLLNISSKALQLVGGNDFGLFSFTELHLLFSRAAPQNWHNYSVANLLYKIINDHKPESLCVKLQFLISVNNRTDKITIVKNNSRKVGLNCLHNRLSKITDHLKFSDFNRSKDNFKLHCKNIFLK